VTPKIELSVVIPAFDERERIGASLDSMRGWLEERHPSHEVLVVDDGSRDETAAIVARAAERWPRLQLLRLDANRGKGAATQRGVLQARGAWVLCSDADLSTPIEEADRLLEAGRRADVVIGSRSIEGADITRRQPLHRVLMGRVFNIATRAVTPGHHADTQCGFKLFRRDPARDVFSRLTIEGFAFDVEVLYLAHRLGYRVAEVPVTWHNDERSSVRIWRDPAKMFVDIFQIRRRHRGLGR
jgi:dolichyl-phosphate beta-glucosyltransferase